MRQSGKPLYWVQVPIFLICLTLLAIHTAGYFSSPSEVEGVGEKDIIDLPVIFLLLVMLLTGFSHRFESEDLEALGQVISDVFNMVNPGNLRYKISQLYSRSSTSRPIKSFIEFKTKIRNLLAHSDSHKVIDYILSEFRRILDELSEGDFKNLFSALDEISDNAFEDNGEVASDLFRIISLVEFASTRETIRRENLERIVNISSLALELLYVIKELENQR